MKAKKLYIILGLAIAILISGYSVYKYMYKDHRDIASESVDFNIKSIELSNAMSNTNDAKKYVDKVIQTSGKVTLIEQKSVILDNKVQVNFSIDDLGALSVESEINIKGRCVGYDDLLELVKIDQATIIK